MQVNRITPESPAHWLELRKKYVSSTESAALFGISPYATAFELWHRKKDKLDKGAVGGRAVWGNRLERSIADGIAEDYGVKIRNMRRYMFDDTIRIGASFDYEIWAMGADTDDNIIRAMRRDEGVGILEIKNVDRSVFYSDWTVDKETGYIEAPAHIEAQVQHQLHVSGYDWAVIAALVGGNDPKITIRKRFPEVGEAIEQKVAEFWKSIADNTPPDPEMPADASFLAGLYQYAEPGKVLALGADEDPELTELVRQYKAAGEIEKKAAEDKKVAQALILQKIGSHERVTSPLFNITAGMVGPSHIEYDRDGYRNFRLTLKKPKGE